MNYNFPLHHYSDYSTANKDSDTVKPGTVLLTGKPFAYSLAPKYTDIRCDTCFKLEGKSGGNEGLILSRCGGCQQVQFCNRDCQRKGWSDGHKYECRGFKTHRRAAGSFTRILLRIIIKVQSTTDYYDEITRRKVRRRFKDLVSHYADLKNDETRMKQVEAMCQIVRSILIFHPEINMPNESELLGICGRIFVNTFSITDYENHTLGTGLYLGASIFDHSCEPMAVASFESTNITIRNIREIPITLPILKVTICYRDVLRPTYIRKEELKKGYYFECQCTRCSQNLYDYSMGSIICSEKCNTEVNLQMSNNKCPKCNREFESEYVNKVAEVEEMAKLKAAEMSDNAYLDVSEACMRLFRNLNFSDTHWLMVEMSGIGFDSCVDMQLWERAYNYGQLAEKGYRAYLFEKDPTLGLFLLKLAKLAWFLEKEKDAKSYVTEAKKILEISPGLDTTFARQNIFTLIREMSLCSNFKNGLTKER